MFRSRRHIVLLFVLFVLQLCLDPEDVYYPSTYLEIAIKKSQMPVSLTLISMLTIIDTVEHNCAEFPEKMLNMLPLPRNVVNSILSEYELQHNTYFNEFVAPHIDYRLPNEY